MASSLLLISCASDPPPRQDYPPSRQADAPSRPNPPLRQADPPAARGAELYERTAAFFDHACYYKPAETTLLDPYQAPLIVQETAPGRDDCPGFGRVVRQGPNVRIDPDRPTVYFQRRVLPRETAEHDQLMFVWFYPVDDTHPSALTVQGLRITYASNGLPAIWEVLANDHPLRVLFVSRFLEQSASAAHGGGVLPGRRHAAEPHDSDVVVARVLDDSPVALGPIVYLADPDHAVNTVICRCMPSQAGEFIRTRSYDLRPLEELFDEGFDLADHLPAAGVILGFAVDVSEDPREFEERLRLPESF